MDILIKNLEIPKEKYIRVEIHHDGTMYVQKSGYYSFYVKSQDKAKELQPHGDLIDRQAVLSYFETAFLMGADMDYEDILGIVSNPKAIPTIVEATE